MSSSASATLFYGYLFDDAGIYPWQDEDDWDSNESFQERDWEPEHFWIHRVLGKTESEVDAMGYKERGDLYRQVPVELGHWGYLEESSYFIRPKSVKAEYQCDWSGSVKIDSSKLIVNPEWDLSRKSSTHCCSHGFDPCFHGS